MLQLLRNYGFMLATKFVSYLIFGVRALYFIAFLVQGYTRLSGQRTGIDVDTRHYFKLPTVNH